VAHLLGIHVGSGRSIGPGIGRVMCAGRGRRDRSIDRGRGIESRVLHDYNEVLVILWQLGVLVELYGQTVNQCV
jgi:hypothetical protein